MFPKYTIVHIVVISVFSAAPLTLRGQETFALPDSTITSDTFAPDTLIHLPDSTGLLPDSIPPLQNAADTVAVGVSSLEAVVTYIASDSIVIASGNRAFLYGKGEVKYQQIELRSEYMEMHLDSSLVFAKFGLDTLGLEFGYPIFKDGDQEYESKTMRYNFKSKKGYSTDLITKQGEGFVTAGLTKKMEDDILYMKDGEYTTCDDPDHAHFYIKMTRAKVRPKKNIVTGPVYLVIADVPIYLLGLPFGYFPFSESYSSGILFPTFGEESARGFYLREGGYYFALSDYMDMAVTGEIYTKGSWGVTARSALRKRYKYSGSLNASYLVTKLGDKGLSDYSITKDFKLAGSFSLDPKSSPYHTFSISANFATSGYDKNNIQGMYVPTSTQNTKSTSISYTKRFPRSPFNISSAFSINQVSRDTMLSVTLPDISINMSRIYPFKRKMAVGSDRWYEKISMSYTGTMRNSISTKEYKFMQSSLVKDWKNGMQHSIPVSATYSVFNFINVSPSVGYRERWYTNRVEKGFDMQTNSVLNVDTTYGFYRVYDYNTSVSASTTVYGFFQPTIPLLSKFLKTVRHRMDMSVSLGYTPDFGDPKHGFYKNYQYADNQGVIHDLTYSPFETGMFGVPGRGQQGNLSFSLDNNVEAKYISKNDSTGEGLKRSLIDKLSLGMSYNIMADSFNWSDLNVGLRLKLTKSYTLNLNGVFETYTYRVDEGPNGTRSFRRQNVMRIASGKGLGRLRSTGTSFAYTINQDFYKTGLIGRLLGLDTDGKPAEPEPSTDNENLSTMDEFGEIRELVPDQNRGRLRPDQNEHDHNSDVDHDGYHKNDFKWSLSFNYSLNLGYGDFNFDKKEYNYRLSHALSFSGNMQPTKNWQLNFNATYDVNAKRLSYLTCNISRNLHCFNMTASIIPVGNYKSYTFSVSVSSSMLKDLKYDRRSNYREGLKWY
ncbi:MAG: LPS-assembly protein LptD [Tannerellaceae bacterium]|jgi:lipopolysaccharide assembly outer membrane protein LptD (OstA)|nr:LPS-assembly protein LptD [Tannerellaceae bacterium]